MSKQKEFVKNTVVLLLGKFCTQFMSFLLLPLYTSRLATNDFGTVDLIQTYISLLVPVLTLRMDSATFRFLIDTRKSPEKTKETISNILIVVFISILVASTIALGLSFFVNSPYFMYIYLNIMALVISSIFLQILRGTGKTVQYAIASVITGVATLLINILQIVVFGYGAESILISSAIANALCIIFVFFSAKLYKNFSPVLIHRKTIRSFLKYSLPMIPNALSWWAVSVSDRTVINIFIGAAANGIYAVSCKFSNILNSVLSIFTMSWQESASLHIDDPDRDEFFTKMINQLLMFFSCVALLILVALPIFYNKLIGEQYWLSYIYIPVLLYANTWNVLINLIGGIYVAKKRTKEIASTTIISGIINLVIDLILIHFIGIHAATISTLASCMVMALYRAHDCQKYVKYKMDKFGIVTFSIIFAASSILYIINHPILNIINLALVSCYIFVANKNSAKSILSMLKHKKVKRHQTKLTLQQKSDKI